MWSSPERPAYPHQALAVVVQVRSGRLHVMLWRRGNEPFAGSWALPGGPLLPDETLGASVARQLASKVEVHQLAHLEQLETRSDPGRDPRGRTVATAYEVTATNLQRMLLRRGVLEATGETAPPGRAGGRPAMLYRFAESTLEVTDPFAVLRPPSSRPR